MGESRSRVARIVSAARFRIAVILSPTQPEDPRLLIDENLMNPGEWIMRWKKRDSRSPAMEGEKLVSNSLQSICTASRLFSPLSGDSRFDYNHWRREDSVINSVSLGPLNDEDDGTAPKWCHHRSSSVSPPMMPGGKDLLFRKRNRFLPSSQAGHHHHTGPRFHQSKPDWCCLQI